MGVNFNSYISVKTPPAMNNKPLRRNEANIETKKWEDKNPETNSGIIKKNPQTQHELLASYKDPGIIALSEFITKMSIKMMQDYDISTKIGEGMGKTNDTLFDASELLEEICNKIDEVSELYKAGGKTAPDGVVLAVIVPNIEAHKETMLEYSENGLLTRKTTFQDGKPQEIEEYRPDGKKNILALNGRQLQEYKEGLVEYGEDAEKPGKTMEKYLTFRDGKPSMYFEGYGEFDDGSSESSKMLWYNDNFQVVAYYEDMINLSDGSSTVGLHLRYNDDNECCEYIENIKNGTPQGVHYKLIDGKWVDKTASTAKPE